MRFLPGFAAADVVTPPSFETTERTPAKAVGTSEIWLKLADRTLPASRGLLGVSNRADATLVNVWSTPDPTGTAVPTSCSTAAFNLPTNSSTERAQTDPNFPNLDSMMAFTVSVSSLVIRCNDDSRSTIVTGKPVTVPTTQV